MVESPEDIERLRNTYLEIMNSPDMLVQLACSKGVPVEKTYWDCKDQHDKYVAKLAKLAAKA